MKLATKRSQIQTHSLHASGSGEGVDTLSKIYTPYPRLDELKDHCLTLKSRIRINDMSYIILWSTMKNQLGLPQYAVSSKEDTASIIRIDGWNTRALIDYYEKIVRIPLPNGEIIEVQGEKPEKDLGSLACIKADKKKLDDIHVV
ncbi:hypothetical protein Tco_0311561 [Tanacetum coccineum]